VGLLCGVYGGRKETHGEILRDSVREESTCEVWHLNEGYYSNELLRNKKG